MHYEHQVTLLKMYATNSISIRSPIRFDLSLTNFPIIKLRRHDGFPCLTLLKYRFAEFIARRKGVNEKASYHFCMQRGSFQETPPNKSQRREGFRGKGQEMERERRFFPLFFFFSFFPIPEMKMKKKLFFLPPPHSITRAHYHNAILSQLLSSAQQVICLGLWDPPFLT